MPTLLLRFCSLAIALLFSAIASAQTPTETALNNGRDWLVGTVQADGGLANESDAIALPGQIRSEAALALHALQALPSQLRDGIHGAAPTGNEFIARRALVLASVGLGDAALASQIEASQNSDGGYGAFAQQQSSTLDTAIALQALAKLTNADSGKTGRALAWLTAARVSSGGFGENGQADVYTTAQVLLAANAWSSRFTIGTLVSPARDYLVAQRGASGGYGEVFIDASALLALAGATADVAVLGPLQQRLLDAQAPDGSWLADPYQTALALRALSFVTQAPPTPTGAEVSARVIDATSGAPLPGVLAQMVQLADASATTVADGNFVIGGLAAGQYTLRLSQLGYERKEFSLTVVAGQNLRMGDIRLRAAPLTSTIFGVVRNSAGSALSNAVVSVETGSVLTNASGAYELSGIASGPATIDVSLPGYRSVSQPIVLEAGVRYSFSPTLYTTNQTPPTTATLRGKIIDTQSNLPIAGASVIVAGITRTTLADGRFEFTALAAGGVAIEVRAATYNTLNATATVVVGINDVGNIGLTKTPATSTLVGTVIDAAGGNPVPGATLVVQGQTATALSGPDGRYTLSGIQGTSLILITSAPGFLSNTLQIGLPQVGVNTLDVPLTALQDVGIRFSGLSTSQPIYQPSDELELEIEVLSVSSSPVEMIVAAEVRDESGDLVYTFKANPQGLGDNPPNLPISFAPNALREIELEWLLARQPAGIYTISALGTGSNGRVLAEATTRFTIAAAPVLAGGVIANPPLTQIDAATPVQLSANLTNFGNLPIPAGDLRLQVVLDHADTLTSTAPRATATAAFAGAPLSNAQDIVRGTNGDHFVLNAGDRKIIRIGSDNVASVFAALPTTMTPDSLAIGADDSLVVASSNSRIVHRVSSAGVVTSLSLARLTLVYDLDVARDGTVYLNGYFSGTEAGVGLNESRLLRLDANGSESVLWQGGMTTPGMIVKTADGSYVVTSLDDNALYKLTGDGRMTRLVAGLKRPRGIAVGSGGEFYVTQQGDNSLVRVDSDGTITPIATGLNNPHDVKLGADGNYYVADFGSDSILKIAPDGSKQVFARGITNQPQAMRYDAAGNLYISNNDGTLRRKASSGEVDVLANGLSAPRGLSFGADGLPLVVEFSSGELSRIGNDGSATTLRSGFSGPYGVAVDAAGRIAVSEMNASQLTLVDADGSVLQTQQNMVATPSKLALADGGAIYVANSNFLTRIEGGIAARVGGTMTVQHMIFDPVRGDLLNIVGGTQLRRTTADGTTMPVKQISFYVYGLGLDASGNPLLLDVPGRKLVRLDSNGVESVAATFASAPSALATDSTGTAYVKFGNNVVHRVNGDGTTTLLVTLTGENIRSLLVTADDKLLAATHTNKSLLIDPATSSFTALPVLGVATTQETRFADGSRVATIGTDDVVFYSAAAVESARVSGFVAPRDIVWTGSEYFFNDQTGDLFSWTPGSYPVKRLAGFASYALDYANNILLGSDGSSLYRFSGATRTLYKGVTGSAMNSVALRADGRFAAGVSSTNRVYEFDAVKNIIGDYVGISGPIGLAFAANGDLVVANYNSSNIARIDLNTRAPRTLAMMSVPKYLAFAPTGELWATNTSGATRVNANGTLTAMGSGVNLAGILFDAATPIAVGGSDGSLRRWTGSAWQPIASSLTRGPLVLDSQDRPVIAGESNRTLSRFDNGALSVIAQGLPMLPLGLARSSGDQFVATGASGIAASISADGVINPLRLQTLVANAHLYSLVFSSPTRAKLLSNNSSVATQRLFNLELVQAPTPPAVGTVVHEVLLPTAAIPVGEDYVDADFGGWMPPYGGDFRVVVEHVGVDGAPSNFVHVGPSALATLSANRETLPPGDQSLRMCLNLTGADFTSLSRVEVSRIRPLVSNTRPNGMVADRAGNIYYTNASGLFRTSTAGVNTTLATGLRTAFGLAIDDNEVLYFPNRNSVTAKYELMRADLSGNVALFAALNVGAANGVAVDSLGNVIVGTAGKLLKVAPAGTITQIATAGLPSPRGITIDGHDNIYVQNESNFVSMVKPDGSTFDLYSGGDGVNNPVFEGDGYPNITADCSSNLYIATSQWSRIGQSGEEHIMAQIVPRTGQVGALFDGHNIAANLTDIDYLAYDRFGDRILFWQDYQNKIWQAPVTCGAIGVEAHLITQPGQVLSGMSRAPSVTIDRAGGGKEYVWSLRDVTVEGEAVCFDAPQAGLQLGELRQTLDSGFMNFQNSFVAGDMRVPIAIPNVRVEDLVAIAVATDKPEYRAGEQALITTTLSNTNPENIDGELRVRVFDADAQLVKSFAVREMHLPANGVASAEDALAIAALLPGSYRVFADLYRGELHVADADTDFVVLADDAPATVSSRVATDKAVYEADAPVTISSRASNLSANLIRENLTLAITVRDAQGDTVFTHGHFIAQALPGASRDFSVVQELENAAAGIYVVEQLLLDAQSRTLDTQTATYQVRSGADSGSGLAGTIDATPEQLVSGAHATLASVVRNDGNAALTALPVLVALVDVQGQNVLASWSETLDLAIGAEAPFSHDWDSARVPSGDYVAVLSATVGGVERVLAQDNVRVVAPDLNAALRGDIVATPTSAIVGEEVQLQSTLGNAGDVALYDLPFRVQLLAAGGDVVATWTQQTDLAIAANTPWAQAWDTTGLSPGAYRAVLSVQIADAFAVLDEAAVTLMPAQAPIRVETSLPTTGSGRVLVLISCRSNELAQDPACTQARVAFLDAYLTELAVTHRIVTTTADFEREFRSGVYNIYWISGGAEKLANPLAEEVREATYRGDGLIVEGNHDSRNQILDEALGVKHIGQLAGNDHGVVVSTTSEFAAASFIGRGDALKYQLLGAAKRHGGFDSANGSPALVSNVHGDGEAVTFAFGLVPTLMQDAVSPTLRRLVSEALDVVNPDQEPVAVAGGFVAITADVQNLGDAATVDLMFSLDAPALIESTTPLATGSDATSASWTVQLAAGERQRVVIGVRLPQQAGPIVVRIAALRPGTSEVLAQSERSLMVRSTTGLHTQLQQALSALNLNGQERAMRDQTLSETARALSAADAGQWNDAFRDLLKARDRLLRISSVPTKPHLLQLAQLLQAVELRWFAAQPPATP